MANTFLTPSLIAKEALMVLRNNAVMANLVYRDYSDEYVAGVGDTITIRKPATFEAKEFTDKITIQDAAEGSVAVQMDKHLDVSFAVTSRQLSLDIADFSEQLIVPAMRAFANKVDKYLIALGEAKTTKISKAGTLVAPVDIISARKYLNDGAVPLTDRRLVVSTQAEADLLQSELFVSAEKVGDTGTALREASLGRKFGFDIYVDQNIGTSDIAFHKNAFALVTRPLAIPNGAKDAFIVNYDGFGLRVVYGYDIATKTDTISIDMLCGVKTLDDTMMTAINETTTPVTPPSGGENN